MEGLEGGAEVERGNHHRAVGAPASISAHFFRSTGSE